MTTDNQAFDLVAADGLRLSFTPIRDWTMLHPELRGTPFQLYAIMRSLVTGSEDVRRTCPVTLDQLCWLLPGVNGKPTSQTALKDALKVLDRLGLITNPNDERLITSAGNGAVETRRRYQVNDLPPARFQGWRSARDKLNGYRADWRTQTPEPPELHVSAKDRQPACSIYVIGAPVSSVAKIGKAIDPEQRLAGIQVGNPERLALRWTTSGGIRLERWLHEEFGHLRLIGEWFDFGTLDPVEQVEAAVERYRSEHRRAANP